MPDFRLEHRWNLARLTPLTTPAVDWADLVIGEGAVMQEGAIVIGRDAVDNILLAISRDGLSYSTH